LQPAGGGLAGQPFLILSIAFDYRCSLVFPVDDRRTDGGGSARMINCISSYQTTILRIKIT
jgi:hypothetical protein